MRGADAFVILRLVPVLVRIVRVGGGGEGRREWRGAEERRGDGEGVAVEGRILGPRGFEGLGGR